MPATRRATIYFEPVLYDALRVKAAELELSISEVVNEVLRQSLADFAEELEDLADLDRRRAEPNIPFEEVLADMEDEADNAIFEQRRNDPTVDFETVAADMKRRGLL